MPKGSPLPEWVRELTEKYRKAPWAIWLNPNEANALDQFWATDVRRRLKLPDLPLKDLWREREFSKTVDFERGGVPRRLNPAQLRAVEALKVSPEVWLLAANRLGKSQLGATITSWFAHGIDPYGLDIPPAPNRMWVGAPDYANNGKKIIQLLHFFLGKVGVQWKRGDFMWLVCSHVSRTGSPCGKKCPEPSEVILKSYDSGAAKWQGDAPVFMWIDETPPEEVYREQSIRVGIGERLRRLYTMTPLRSSAWIKADLYDRWRDAGRPDSVAFIEGSIWENFYLPNDVIDKLKEKYKHDPDEMKARLWGLWSMTPGVVFPMLDGSVHRVPDFEIPGVHRAPDTDKGELPWTIYRALDPGIRNPTAVLWCAVAPNGLCYVYRDDEIKDLSIPEVCQRVFTQETPHERNRFRYTVIDPAAAQRDLVDASRRIDAYATHGLACLPGNNDRIYGIDKLKQAFHWEKDEADNFRKEPKYRFFESCHRTWDELRRYSWLPAKEQAVRGPRDDAVKKDDHLVDCIRYLEATFVGPVFGGHLVPEPDFVPADERTGY